MLGTAPLSLALLACSEILGPRCLDVESSCGAQKKGNSLKRILAPMDLARSCEWSWKKMMEGHENG
eukprot:2890787-Rhodomonas_salina.1